MPPPQLIETEDGSHSLFSDLYKVSYHSKYGAVQETAHVFIDAGLNFQRQRLRSVSILEVGFGSGLNALMTLQAAKEWNLNILYHTIEPNPIPSLLVPQLNYIERLDVPHLQDSFMQMHALSGNQVHQLNDQFHFCKWIEKLETFKTSELFDVIYFDAFAPASQPELWSEEVFRAMYDCLRPNGVLVTYCAKGVVKRTLKAVGFKVEGIPGPPGKREMTRAMKTEVSI